MPFFRRNQVKRRWQRELPLVQTITPEEVFYEYEYDYIYEDSYGYTTDYGTMTTRVPSDRKSLPSIRSDTGTTIPSIIDDPFDFNHSVPIDLKLGQPFEIDIRDYANLPTAIRTYLTKRPYWLTLKDTFFIRGNAPLNLNIGDSIEIDILLELLNNRSTISFKLNVTQSAFFWNKLDRDVTVKAIEHYTETVTEHYNETVTEHYTDTVTEHYTERVTTTDTVTETVTETVDVPISVILLVDRSGSMATANRIGSAKAGMRQILGELKSRGQTGYPNI